MATVTLIMAVEPSDVKTRPESLSVSSFPSRASLTIKSSGT